MPRSRQRRGPQARGLSSAGQEQGIKPILQKQKLARGVRSVTDLFDKVDELRTAGEVDGLPVVDFHSPDGERGGLTAQEPAALEERHLEPLALELHSRAEPGQPSADDRYAT